MQMELGTAVINRVFLFIDIFAFTNHTIGTKWASQAFLSAFFCCCCDARYSRCSISAFETFYLNRL